ncbi:MAG TPA: hypothetical protein VHU15_03005 [Stellaceae bacterium]|jgi:hypothetical protein|nr:hypothetical protein [Stellaceae bacterium]
MPAVETRITRRSFADTLGAMRDWLDHNASGPVKFETASTDDGVIVIRVEFDRDDQAQQFAAKFPSEAAAARIVPPLASPAAA